MRLRKFIKRLEVLWEREGNEKGGDMEVLLSNDSEGNEYKTIDDSFAFIQGRKRVVVIFPTDKIKRLK